MYKVTEQNFFEGSCVSDRAKKKVYFRYREDYLRFHIDVNEFLFCRNGLFAQG